MAEIKCPAAESRSTPELTQLQGDECPTTPSRLSTVVRGETRSCDRSSTPPEMASARSDSMQQSHPLLSRVPHDEDCDSPGMMPKLSSRPITIRGNGAPTSSEVRTPCLVDAPVKLENYVFLIIYINIYGIVVSQIHFFSFWKQNHWHSHPGRSPSAAMVPQPCPRFVRFV